MTNIELKEITEKGEVTLDNGQLNQQSSYTDFEKLLGALVYKGDYQLLEFYETKSSIRLLDSELILGLTFKEERVVTIKLSLSHNEINKIADSLNSRQTISKAKELLDEFLTVIIKGRGTKIETESILDSSLGDTVT